MQWMYRVQGKAKTDRGDGVRYLGKVQTASGRLGDAKFYLGREERTGTINRIRLENFWSRVVDSTTVDAQPVWDAISYDIAKEVCRGGLGTSAVPTATGRT